MNTDPLQSLETTDLALLNLLLLNAFDLRACISSDPDTHPAARTYVTLLLWLDSPAIRPAYEALLALEAEKSAAADIVREERARSCIEFAVSIARKNLADASRIPDNHDQINRRARELRLLARPLIRTTRASRNARSTTTHHTIPENSPTSPPPNPHTPSPQSSSSGHDITARESAQTTLAQPALITTDSDSPLSTSTFSHHTPSPDHSTISNLLSAAHSSFPPLTPHTISAATRILNAVGTAKVLT